MKGIYDMHCHVIYDVDDGPSHIEESCQMIQEAAAQGIKGMFLTSHFRRDLFEPAQKVVEAHYNALLPEAEKAGVRLYHGCEYHGSSEIVDDFLGNRRWTLADSSYVLVEYAGMTPFSYIRENCRILLNAGFIPVVAHIERYKCLSGKYQLIDELTDMGARMQINADSVLGKEGFRVKRFCTKLMKYDLVSFIGSDSHGTTRRASHLVACSQYVEKKMGTEYAHTIFIENPEKIIKNFR